MPNVIQGNNLTKEQYEVLKAAKIMIATPMYGGNCLGPYMTSTLEVFRMAGQLGLNVVFQSRMNESLVQRARNACAHAFMKSDCTHLIFIDGDIAFQPTWIYDLVLQQKDIIGGFYPKKCINWDTVLEAAIKHNVPKEHLNHCGADIVPILKPMPAGTQIQIWEPLEVYYLGTGFMCITRTAFEKFQTAYPDKHYRNNHVGEFPRDEDVWAYFDCIIDENRVYLSEDYYFCNVMQKAGVNIYACPWMNCSHIGTYIFQGCMWCSKGTFIHDIRGKAPETTIEAPPPKSLLEDVGDQASSLLKRVLGKK